MNVRTLMISIFLASAFGGPAEADQFLTGDELLRACTGTEQINRIFCLGVITGYYEMLATSKASCDDDSKETAGQITDVVVKYLKEHPADRSKPAVAVSATAIFEALHCVWQE